jgi:quinol monooxygenase YgiN
VKNYIDRVASDRITELWPVGGRQLGLSWAIETSKWRIFVPIYQTAHYRVNPAAVDKVKAAIVEFVEYVTEHEPGTQIYTAWQQQSDPTKFVHLFEFADEEAHQAHGASAAVRKFEEVYRPELAAGPVVFTDYLQIASTHR